MGRHAKLSRESILAGTIGLIETSGAEAATVRGICGRLGVSEAAIYRYFASKDDMTWQAYARIVAGMVEEKRHLVDDPRPFRVKLREWVSLSYGFFDRHREAFAYVLLSPPPPMAGSTKIVAAQGTLFRRMVARARAAGEIRDLPPELALSHFTGLMLNVPRLIRQGTLRGPAMRYLDEVADAAWQVLRIR